MWRGTWRHLRVRTPNTFAVYSRTNIRYLSSSNIVKTSSKEEGTIQSKVTDFIKRILNQESQALSDSFNRNLVADELAVEEEMEIFIHPKLKNDLNKILDNNNKLFMVLTYNPILIDSRLYISLYDKLDTQIDSNLRTLLYKRLLFLQEYEACWRIVLDSYNSITDIEEFLDLAFKCFSEHDDLEFGRFKLLVACYSQQNISQTLKNHVIETVIIKYNLERSWIEKCLQFQLEIDGIQTVSDLHKYCAIHQNAIQSDSTLQMIYLKKLLTLEEYKDINALHSTLTVHGDITKFPGWLSSIAPGFSLSNCLTSHQALDIPAIGQLLSKTINLGTPTLNTLDTMYALNAADSLHPYLIYSIYISRFLKTKRIPNRYIINHLFRRILAGGETVQIRSVLFQNWKILNEDLLMKAMAHLFEKGTNEFLVFFELFKHDKGREGMVESFFRSVEGKYIEVTELKALVDQCYLARYNKCVRGLVKSVTLGVYSPGQIIEFHGLLINDHSLRSKQLLLESFRCLLLRAKLINQELTTSLVDRLLHVSLPPNKILKREKTSNATFHYDIQRLLYLASADERAQFHNVIRSLGQSISLLDSEQCSSILNMLDVAINHNSVIRSTYGREYIINNIISETVRFTERKLGPKASILKIRDIKSKLDFKSKIDACLFRLIVQDEPQNALKLINHYKDKKQQLSGLLEHMMSGILASHRLSKGEKFTLLDRFLKELKDLGYEHRLRQLTGYQILKVLSEKDQHDQMQFAVPQSQDSQPHPAGPTAPSDPRRAKLEDSAKLLALNMMKSNKSLHRPVLKNLKKLKKL